MSSDSTMPSKRTQLTDRPKLSLQPAPAKPRGAKASSGGARPKPGFKKGQKSDSPRPPAKPVKSAAPGDRPAGNGPAGNGPAKKKINKPSKKDTLTSRRICFDILVAVAEGAQLDAALNASPDLDTLEDRDRRFVQLLATTCLRRRGQLERVIAPMVSRRPFGAAENANTILVMGAAQLLILKTEAHAAVDSTVELMREAGFDRLTGMANAVMRRMTREGEARLTTTTPSDNLPDWLMASWSEHYGAAATAEITALATTPPPLDITPKHDAAGWTEKLGGTLINSTTIRREFDGDVTKLDGFAEGEWWVQDAAAALAATLLGDLNTKSVIDLCAAPGGKTAQLIAAGASVTAIDSSRKRIDRLRRNLKRLALEAKIVLGDGRTYQPDHPVDHVLLDAPCSATGTVRRRPDILARRTPEDISELQAMQWELTTAALGWLKPGGTLIYATCSLQPEEGEQIIAAVLEAAEGRFVLDPVSPAEAGDFAASITAEGTLRIIPSDYAALGGVDGFYISRLKSVG
jgi:16S rRNA (cytosine967-C5)-methyltransferase